MADRKVLSDGSQMHIRTNRIGLLTIHATAPVVGGTVSATMLEFTVRIDRVATGNPALDPELHALIRELTNGILRFEGRRAGGGFEGRATAGNIEVPLNLSATPSTSGPLLIEGTSSFADVHVPLPGMGHIRHLEVDIDGHIHLG